MNRYKALPVFLYVGIDIAFAKAFYQNYLKGGEF